jgi:PucR-like helix-turn-helix protein/diguanylate cyclase with GGDEF domain
MEAIDDRTINDGFAALASDLQGKEEELIQTLVGLISTQVAYFRTGTLDHADLYASVADRFRIDLQAIQEIHVSSGGSGQSGRADPPGDSVMIDDHLDMSGAASAGARWARKGIPLPDIVAANGIAARFVWKVVAEAAAHHGIPDGALVAVASGIFALHDRSIDAVTSSYVAESRAKMRGAEAQRAALVSDLLDGRTLSTVRVSEIAELLRLPRCGPFVVVIADSPVTAGGVLGEAEERLRSANFVSAWRLTSELQIGIVSLPNGDRDSRGLAELLRSSTASRCGISPVYDDLSGTAAALTLARTALRAALSAPLHVVDFNDSPLNMTAVAEPEINARIAQTVLAGLDELNAEQRALLLETLEVWIDNAGSTAETAGKLFIHRNTVRQRLARLEALTCRSLSEPRDVAELCIAMATRRRLAHIVLQDASGTPAPTP